VIGFLRFVGVFNAAVWFGAAVSYALVVSPALASPQLAALLTAGNFPFFSVAIAQLVAARYFQLQLACGFLALFHLLGEWLYLGKVQERVWRGLLCSLVALTLASGFFLEPRLEALHQRAFAVNRPPQTRASAASAFRAWQRTAEVVNFLLAGGLGVYLWRMANPPDPTRVLSAGKFRG
jgi:hypothetical protein